jgi:ribonuclease T1
VASSSAPGGRSLVAGVVAVLLFAVVLAWWVHGDDGGSSSRPSAPAASAPVLSDQILLADLPPEARRTVALIQHGGPYPYARDGVTFGNLEGRLPPQPTGYYHEYTVPTPGAADRGARRIVLGAAGQLYWSPDHYRTFKTVLGAEAEQR